MLKPRAPFFAAASGLCADRRFRGSALFSSFDVFRIFLWLSCDFRLPSDRRSSGFHLPDLPARCRTADTWTTLRNHGYSCFEPPAGGPQAHRSSRQEHSVLHVPRARFRTRDARGLRSHPRHRSRGQAHRNPGGSDDRQAHRRPGSDYRAGAARRSGHARRHDQDDSVR